MFGRRLPPATTKRWLLDLGAAELTRLSAYFGELSKTERKASVELLEGLFFGLVSKMAPPLFIEAGAKDPLVSRRVRELLGATVSVVAFEANPFTFERFNKTRDHAALGVDYRNVALSTEPGSVTFNVRRREDGLPHADGRASLLKQVTYEHGHIEVSVDATTLDLVVGEFGVLECMLWVDVEGALREVLSGGKETLERAQVVFIEVEDRQVWEGQWLAARVQEFFLEAGLSPVARDFQSKHQYNLVFVRNDLLDSPHFTSSMDSYYASIGATGRGLSARRRYRIARQLFR